MDTENIASATPVKAVPVAPVVEGEIPLSAEEQETWDNLVRRGKEILGPHLAKLRDPEFRKNNKRYNKYVPEKFSHIPAGVKRYFVARTHGLTFKQAASATGVIWADIAKLAAGSETVRCAREAQEEASRFLLKQKALSVQEMHLDEDSKVSMAKAQVAGMILNSLDRKHFGDDGKRRGSDDEETQEESRPSGGGFIIKLVGEAAKKVAAAPAEAKGKALVFAEV